jgi:tetraacyldisaccharide 4'-kinase
MLLLSYIFGFIVLVRSKLYELGIIKQYKSKSFVISTGNIVAGGTGKTPIIIHLAKILKSHNLKVGIVGGGYRRKEYGFKVVHDGRKINCTVAESGDEAMMIAEQADTVLVVDDKKYKALSKLDEKFDLDVVLIDDGFQHRKIERDLDIVIINQRTIDEKHYLPKGYLREKKSSLKRADLLLARDIDKSILSKFNKPTFQFSATIDPNHINDARSVVITAIANPDNFVNFLKTNRANIARVFEYKDHHFFTKNDIEEVVKYCNWKDINRIYTTEKDRVKLLLFTKLFEDNSISVLTIPMKLEFEDEVNFEKYILEKINEKIK